MSKIEKLRRAGKLCWLFSASTTFLFLLKVSNKVTDLSIFIIFIPLLLLALGTQYILTLIESSLFDGTLPAPWQVKLKNGGPIVFIYFLAITCSFIDVMLNISGVSLFFSQFETSMQNEVIGYSSSFLQIFKLFALIVISLVGAWGPELLEAYAQLIETRLNPVLDKKEEPKKKQQQKPTREEWTEFDEMSNPSPEKKEPSFIKTILRKDGQIR